MSNILPKIMVIYTGGTIGMVANPESGSLTPFDFSHIRKQVPEVNKFKFTIDATTFSSVVDSSNMHPEIWVKLAEFIQEVYYNYDGFVILHGTDTMAYTASALSFLLENLAKPIVFTGSQLPIGTIRTDGKENLISAIEIAAAQKDGHPLVPEVSIFFQNKLFRGNRTTKYNADYFDAFRSHNYPELAKAGINITYNYAAIRYKLVKKELVVYHKLNPNVAILKIFPGIQPSVVDAIIKIKGLKALVLETFGSGNAPTSRWFTKKIHQAISNGLLVLNVTQCSAGSVDMGVYETSEKLLELGVISGRDITTEAAVTKLMFLLEHDISQEQIKDQLLKSLRGEINA